MTRSNIVFFTGPNHIFLRRDLDAWIAIFAKKYGEYNISRLDTTDLTASNIQSELLTPIFLGEKRLVILEGVPFSTSRTEENKVVENTSSIDLEGIILGLLDTIPETTIVLFVATEPDKRKSLYKKLLLIATLKEYKKLEGRELHTYIRKRLPHIDVTALPKFIEYTGADINRIAHEIDKLSLYKQDGWITEQDIRSYIVPTIETSIFALTDAIFSRNSELAYHELSQILDTHNIHQVFATLCSSIRTFLYVAKLLSLGHASGDIVSGLKVHPFVFEKMQKNIRFSEQIFGLFSSFVLLDKKTKTGEGIGDTDAALKIGIERLIFGLQKR